MVDVALELGSVTFTFPRIPLQQDMQICLQIWIKYVLTIHDILILPSNGFHLS